MYDIVIIGAGPAGLTAALYGARGGKSVLMIDKAGYGGQIINAAEVENYPGTGNISGFDLVKNIYEQASGLGAEIEFGNVTGVEKEDGYFVVDLDSGKKIDGKTIILATGVKPRALGIEGEDRYVGSGLSFCATCDGAFYKGKEVAVMGGGNTALEDAEVLSNMAAKVYLVHRRNSFRGDISTVKRLEKKDNIEFVLESRPVEIIGKNKIEAVVVENKKGDKRKLDIDGIFIAYGHEPQNEPFKNIAKLNDEGYFDSGEDCETVTPGVFTAGDARRKERRQIVTATSDGSIAAMAAIDYLNRL
jgi:thioredoxin reductase (NADPH)